MSSYVKRAMQHNEKVLYAAQLHWIIYKMGFTFTILALIVGYYGPTLVAFVLGEKIAGALSDPIRYTGAVLIVIGAFQLIGTYIRQISTELVITDQRVIAKHGLIATTSYELMISKVEGATIDQSVMGRLLGYGTLMVKGTGGGISPIDHVADPYRFHSFLMNSVREAQENPHAGHPHD